MTKLTIDERILVEVLYVLDTTISLLESSKSRHFPRIISAYNDLRSAMYNSEYNADPSCTTVGLAEMILSDLVERLGGIEYLESRSSKPVQNPLTYEQIQQLYIKAYNGGDHGRDFETAFVKEIEAAHGITGIRE